MEVDGSVLNINFRKANKPFDFFKDFIFSISDSLLEIRSFKDTGDKFLLCAKVLDTQVLNEVEKYLQEEKTISLEGLPVFGIKDLPTFTRNFTKFIQRFYPGERLTYSCTTTNTTTSSTNQQCTTFNIMDSTGQSLLVPRSFINKAVRSSLDPSISPDLHVVLSVKVPEIFLLLVNRGLFKRGTRYFNIDSTPRPASLKIPEDIRCLLLEDLFIDKDLNVLKNSNFFFRHETLFVDRNKFKDTSDLLVQISNEKSWYLHFLDTCPDFAYLKMWNIELGVLLFNGKVKYIAKSIYCPPYSLVKKVYRPDLSGDDFLLLWSDPERYSVGSVSPDSLKSLKVVRSARLSRATKRARVQDTENNDLHQTQESYLSTQESKESDFSKILPPRIPADRLATLTSGCDLSPIVTKPEDLSLPSSCKSSKSSTPVVLDIESMSTNEIINKVTEDLTELNTSLNRSLIPDDLPEDLPIKSLRRLSKPTCLDLETVSPPDPDTSIEDKVRSILEEKLKEVDSGSGTTVMQESRDLAIQKEGSGQISKQSDSSDTAQLKEMILTNVRQSSQSQSSPPCTRDTYTSTPAPYCIRDLFQDFKQDILQDSDLKVSEVGLGCTVFEVDNLKDDQFISHEHKGQSKVVIKLIQKNLNTGHIVQKACFLFSVFLTLSTLIKENTFLVRYLQYIKVNEDLSVEIKFPSLIQKENFEDLLYKDVYPANKNCLGLVFDKSLVEVLAIRQNLSKQYADFNFPVFNLDNLDREVNWSSLIFNSVGDREISMRTTIGTQFENSEGTYMMLIPENGKSLVKVPSLTTGLDLSGQFRNEIKNIFKNTEGIFCSFSDLTSTEDLIQRTVIDRKFSIDRSDLTQIVHNPITGKFISEQEKIKARTPNFFYGLNTIGPVRGILDVPESYKNFGHMSFVINKVSKGHLLLQVPTDRSTVQSGSTQTAMSFGVDGSRKYTIHGPQGLRSDFTIAKNFLTVTRGSEQQVSFPLIFQDNDEAIYWIIQGHLQGHIFNTLYYEICVNYPGLSSDNIFRYPCYVFQDHNSYELWYKSVVAFCVDQEKYYKNSVQHIIKNIQHGR